MEDEPIRLCDIGDYEPISWYWEGYIAPFRKTIFVGHPKAGKTTLMSHLVKGLSGVRCAIGPPVSPARTLILTEEHIDLWNRRGKTLNIDGREIWIKRVRRVTSHEEWTKQLLEFEKFMLAHNITVLIIDTLSHIWPCLDENDAIAVGRALDPLNELANRGTAVVCIHHAPKAKQSAVISARGSTAIPAFFDIVINMRTAGKGTHTTRRSLKAWGRDLETPESLILDYQGEEGYTSTSGDEDDFDEEIAAMDMEVVIAAIPTSGESIGVASIRKQVKMAHSTIKPLLDRAVLSKRIHCDGTGVKGNPFRYIQAEGRNGDS